MKKFVCFLLVFALLGLLTACNFTQKASGAFAGEAESTPKVKEMLTALAENRLSDAKALLHPQVSEKADAAIDQLSAYLAGRNAQALELRSINVSTSTGSSGKLRQEQAAYQVTLSDGAVVYLNVVYLSNNAGAGFGSFQLVLGVV